MSFYTFENLFVQNSKMKADFNVFNTYRFLHTFAGGLQNINSKKIG